MRSLLCTRNHRILRDRCLGVTVIIQVCLSPLYSQNRLGASGPDPAQEDRTPAESEARFFSGPFKLTIGPQTTH
jgi:hypothetical protein